MQGLPATHADFAAQVAGINAVELGEAVQQLRSAHRAELAADKRLKLQVRLFLCRMLPIYQSALHV